MPFKDATIQEVEKAMQNSGKAFMVYRRKSLKERAVFLHQIAKELEGIALKLIDIAHQETHLEEVRLKGELTRTIFQLTSYAAACEEGTWLDIRINTSKQNDEKAIANVDLRKMLIPLGPVVVFGASNFPFAYSTSGGDTACALAAGCSVVLKAHPAHAATSDLVATAIHKAALSCGLPENIFIHLHGASFEVGKALVTHPLTKAIGFTGSFEGGKALFDLANQRPVPIPVFAEMGSINPVFILPQKLTEDIDTVASMYAKSITQSAGQFCTNPGLLVGIKSKALDEFKERLGSAISQEPPVKMLHIGIAKNFQQKRSVALHNKAVSIIATTAKAVKEDESIPTLAEVSADEFIKDPLLQKEVFGPYSLLVECENQEELYSVALTLEGQLTCSLIATDNEIKEQRDLIDLLQGLCGRLILNGVPTGVEVALAMHHGGPYPATTDSRFTAVGADGIKRFTRPICFQNWKNDLLPDELKNENSLQLWRTVNNQLTKEPIAVY